MNNMDITENRERFDRLIMIKYGELTTKKDNRKLFINALYYDLIYKLAGLDYEITKEMARMFIEFHAEDFEEIKKRMSHVFGIHAYSLAYKVKSDEQAIIDEIVKRIKDQKFKTFKVETKRSDKDFPIDSPTLSKKMGGVILKTVPNISVDVHNPELTVNIEIRRDYTYIYFEEFKGIGGYPYGVQGKGLLMLSGGIDSPVAGYLAMKRGIKLDAVYFEAIPHTSMEARNKVIELVKKLNVYGQGIRLIIVPFTEIQEAIYKNCDPEYVITLMRRMMYRIMERLVKRNKAHVIINGESIGQVASQTLTSMEVINNVTNIPVIRPVACLDKLEIIEISKKIDTYEISILPYEDCCTVFVPKHPVINPVLEKCEREEEKIDYKTMIDNTINNLIYLKVNDYERDYEDVL